MNSPSIFLAAELSVRRPIPPPVQPPATAQDENRAGNPTSPLRFGLPFGVDPINKPLGGLSSLFIRI
jgi:hypothetical protein